MGLSGGRAIQTKGTSGARAPVERAEWVRGRGLSSETCQAGDTDHRGERQAQERKDPAPCSVWDEKPLKVWDLSGDRLRFPF